MILIRKNSNQMLFQSWLAGSLLYCRDMKNVGWLESSHGSIHPYSLQWKNNTFEKHCCETIYIWLRTICLERDKRMNVTKNVVIPNPINPKGAGFAIFLTAAIFSLNSNAPHRLFSCWIWCDLKLVWRVFTIVALFKIQKSSSLYAYKTQTHETFCWLSADRPSK